MAFPNWNSEWEKPDPLRGKQGWCRHQYANVGVAVVLLIAAFIVVTPAIVRARQREAEVDRTYKVLEAAMGAGESDTLRPR